MTLFAEGEALTAARGHFVHVYVGRADRHPRFATDIFLPIFDVIEFFKHRHRNDNIVFLKGVDGQRFVQQHVGIEDK